MTSVRPRRWLARLFASKADKKTVSPYHAVAIRCTDNACQAAQDSQGERHVSAEAPRLPLDQCDRPDQCDCRYQHYDDRRADSRRGSDNGSSPKGDSEHVGDTVGSPALDVSESEGVDPYNSGSFDKSKSWKSSSGE